MESVSEQKLLRMLSSKFGHVTESNGGNGKELIVDCPFCGRHKLSVNAVKGIWQCWHCHMSGTTAKLLGRSVRARVAETRMERPKDRGYISPGDLVPLDVLPDDHEACLYLRSRNFDPKVLSRNFGLMFCSHGRPFAGGVFNTSGTIVIPVQENGKLVAWQARLLYDPQKVPPEEMAAYGFVKEDGKFKVPPKYFTQPGFKKGDHFFNFDQASKFGFVVVTEGAFDSMRVGRCSVAAFGKGLSDVQVEILRECWPVVVLLLDPDAEADQEELKRRIEGTGPFGASGCTRTKVVSVHLSGYKDAGDAPQHDVVRQIVLAASADGVDLGKIEKSNPFKLKE